jgi:hypothetical protein
MDENDDGARLGSWAVLAIITLLLFGLIGGLAIRAGHARQVPAAPAAAAPVAAVVGVDVPIEGPLAGEIAGKLSLEVAKAELPADPTAGLAPVLLALAANPGKKLVIAGFQIRLVD